MTTIIYGKTVGYSNSASRRKERRKAEAIKHKTSEEIKLAIRLKKIERISILGTKDALE